MSSQQIPSQADFRERAKTNDLPIARLIGFEAKDKARSIADEKWWEVFQDEQLRELIKTALQQNYDVRIVRMTFTSVSDYLPVPFGSQGPASPDSAPLYLLDASVYETIWMQKGHTETHPKVFR